MNYFYVYSKNADKLIENYCFQNYEIQKNNIYIDQKDDANWCLLEDRIHTGDSLYICGISHIASDVSCLLHHIQFLLKKGIDLKLLDNSPLNIPQLIEAINFVKESNYNSRHEKQMEGIKRALEKKRNGKGKYGRPKIIIPDDFEDNIKKIMLKQMRHEEYRAQLGFKRSTYFKFVKDVKEAWKQDEIERGIYNNGSD